MTEIKKKTSLIPKSARTVVNEAKQFIIDEARGLQTGLLLRFDKLNRGVGKYMRFATIYLIAGASGSGKSYLLSMIYYDFCNGLLNKLYKGKDFMILHFGFEMEAKKELVRMVSSDVGVSYSLLTTSLYDKGLDDYPAPDPKLMELALQKLDNLAGLSIAFYELSGNLLLMENSVAEAHQRLPDKELIIGLDHTLLVEKLNEKDEIELLAAVGKFAIKMKKQYGAMVLMLGQLNTNIQKPERRDSRKPELHYPVQSDIHGSQQVNQAADCTIIMNRPDRLGIKYYGERKIVSADIIHACIVKSRDGKVGSVWLKDEFDKGRLVETLPRTKK